MKDQTNTSSEIFEPYDRLVEIEICGVRHEVPENNSILRCLQFLDIEKISHADLCWNSDCLNCQVWIAAGEKEKALIACRSKVEEGMRITRMSPEIS